MLCKCLEYILMKPLTKNTNALKTILCESNDVYEIIIC